MRKIETPEEKEKRRRRNGIITGTIMLSILILGTIGFAFSFNEKTQQVNNNLDNPLGKKGIELNGRTHYFLYPSEETKDIDVMNIHSDLSYFSGKPLYIDSDNSAVSTEIASNLVNYVPRIQEACYGECAKDLPIKNCTDNIIIIKYSNESRVYQQEGCYFILGGVKEADALLYKILNIK